MRAATLFRRSARVLGLVLLAGFYANPAPAAPAYSITALGTLPGSDSQFGFAINGSGMVSGAMQYSNPTHSYAVVWDAAGTPTLLQPVGPDVTGNPDGSGFGINSSGVVVGRTTPSNAHPVRWPAGSTSPTELDNLGAPSGVFPFGVALAINAGGTAVGTVDVYSGAFRVGSRAVLWAAGATAVTPLAPLAVDAQGHAEGSANAINDLGVIVGQSGAAGGFLNQTRPVRWDSSLSQPVELATPLYSFGSATAINNSGAIAGWEQSTPLHTAVRWDAGSTTAIPLSTFDVSYNDTLALAINSSGEIVGTTHVGPDIGDFQEHAIYWPAGATTGVDLNSLVDPSSGWSILMYAQGINDVGQITGYGLYDPDGPGPAPASLRAFVMTPAVPEPASLSIVAIAFGGLLCRPRKVP